MPYTQTLPDVATFERFAARPGFLATAHTEVVKFVLELEGAERVLFIDSTRYGLHFEFVREHLDPEVEHAQFNTAAYRSPDRAYVLGTLSYFRDADLYTFELVAGDTLDGPRLVKAFERVRDATFLGERLRFRPTGPQHHAIAEAMGERLPVVDEDALHGSMQYLPIVPGEAYGRLRIVRAPLERARLAAEDIVVTDLVPEDLPPITALVTSTFQAPLAHVAVLARSRGMPNMSLRNASTNEAFTALEGRPVRLVVRPQDYELIEVTEAELAAVTGYVQPQRSVRVPPRDLAVSRLFDACEVDLSDLVFVGAKAARFGALSRVPGIETPCGFVVPFVHYAQHLARSGVDAEVSAFLARDLARRETSTRGRDAELRSQELSTLRTAIERAPALGHIVREVHARIVRGGHGPHIFRSSTNAEDLEGFTGAGLYDSVVVPERATEEDVARALRRVWASVFLERAYDERTLHGIDHAAVGMAVLVQPFVADVVASGVAITVNPYDQGRPGVYWNTQVRGAGVTDAESDERPEQWLVYTWSGVYEPERIARSNRTGGQPILTAAEVLELTAHLVRVDEVLGRDVDRGPIPMFSGMGFDVEFLLTRDPRRFVFVQARPFEVQYTREQRVLP